MRARDFARIRKRLFQTRREAAAALGVTKACISHWENGTRPVSKMAQLFIMELEKNLATRR